MTYNLTLRQLEIIATASQSATFSEAARRLNISQPSLSNTIRKVEDEIGVLLFDRTTRSLRLTQEGKRLATVAEDVVRNMQVALRGMSEAAKGERGRLSIAALPSVATSILPLALKAFLGRYPDYEISIRDVPHEQVIGLVTDGAAQFGITTAGASLPQLTSTPLVRDVFQIICRKSDELASQPIVTWAAAARFPIILAGRNRITRHAISTWAQAEMIVEPKFEVDQIMSALALVSAGLGVTVLPTLSVPASLRDDLVAAPLEEPAVHRQLEIVRRVDRFLSPPIEFALQCMNEAVAEFRGNYPGLIE